MNILIVNPCEVFGTAIYIEKWLREGLENV